MNLPPIEFLLSSSIRYSKILYCIWFSMNSSNYFISICYLEVVHKNNVTLVWSISIFVSRFCVWQEGEGVLKMVIFVWHNLWTTFQADILENSNYVFIKSLKKYFYRQTENVKCSSANIFSEKYFFVLILPIVFL